MFGSRLTQRVAKGVVSRNVSSIPTTLYNGVWRKSNVLYIAYIATGCVVLGSLYGGFFNTVWESNNRGVIDCIFSRFVHRKVNHACGFVRLTDISSEIVSPHRLVEVQDGG